MNICQTNNNLSFQRVSPEPDLWARLYTCKYRSILCRRYQNAVQAIYETKLVKQAPFDLVVHDGNGLGMYCVVKEKGKEGVELTDVDARFINITNNKDCVKQLTEWMQSWINKFPHRNYN